MPIPNYKMKSYQFISILFAVTILATYAASQESIYPSGYNIQNYYTLSETEIAFADTLIIYRKVVNNESFILENLYFSENLPIVFEVVDQSTTINGISIDYFSSGPISSAIVTGYNTFHWVVDSPASGEDASITLNPGDSIQLEIKVISNNPGIFTLPLNTTVFYGNGTGFFSASSDLVVEFLLSVDAPYEGENDNKLLPCHLESYAGPNPFNSAVKIWYSGANQAQYLDFEVFNILGQKIYSSEILNDLSKGEISWSPDKNIGSGVYFYKISSIDDYYMGKLIFLK